MRTEVKLPKFNLSAQSATVGSVLVKKNDYVESDDELMQMESDKMMFPIQAPISGYITEILAEEGEEVNVGASLIVISDKQE